MLERRVPVAIIDIDVGLASDESVYDFRIFIASRDVKWRITFDAELVNIRTLIEQEEDTLEIIGKDCVRQLLIDVGAALQPRFQTIPIDTLIGRNGDVRSTLILDRLRICAVRRQITSNETAAALGLTGRRSPAGSSRSQPSSLPAPDRICT